ncbi:hypothetical protein D3C81_1548630 [compost metagenome]
MGANVVGARQAGCDVVQFVAAVGLADECAGQVVADGLGVIDVEVEHQALLVADRQRPVDVAVPLAEVVFDVRVVDAGAEVVVDGIGATEDVSFGQVQAVVEGLVLRVQGSEVTGMQGQAVDFVAGDQAAFGHFRQQSAVVGCQYRQGGELITPLDYGVGEARLHCAAGFRVFIL